MLADGNGRNAKEQETKTGEGRGGYAGRFLRVDLDAMTVTVEETPDPRKWLGPRGWNALIGWREVRPGVGPFDPENRIVFAAGPLVGTGAPTAGRMTVSTIGPRGYPEPMWTSASMGGYLGAELKYAGYDGIVVHGQAERPCYLLIEDETVTLEDASDLWGQGTFDTQRALKARHGRQHQIATIGPAGENRVRFASIIHRLSNAVGNGGFGGVMGAKRLKAIVVRGTRGVPIADPPAFLDETQRVFDLVRGGLGYAGQIDRGYPVVACTHGCSVRCGTSVADAPQTLVDGLPRRMIKCVNGSWQRGSHPAYEGVHVDGHELTVPRPPGLGEAVGLDLGNLIEDMGLTTWFYDTWYRWLGGLREMGIDDVDGLAIDIEDPTWWRDLVLSVAHRQGLGDDIAEGLARFYERHPVGPEYLAEFIQGRGSRGHSWHREGRAMEPHPSPYWEYSALLYAVSTRDVTPSTHGFFFLNGLYGRPEAPLSPDEISPVLKALAERVYGSEKAVYPGGDEVEQVTAWHQHRAIIKDSLGLCDWVFPVIRRTMPSREALQEALERGDIEAVYGDIDAEATLLRAATGLDMGTPALERAAARVVTLERCLDVRNHGRDRDADEVVVTHYQWTEKTDRTHVSARADEFRALLDRYYDLRGWSRETGAPLPEALRALGLEDVVAVEAGASTVGE